MMRTPVLRQAFEARTRSVAGMGRLIGAAFALRGVVPLFCVRVLHLEPNAGAATGLTVTPLLLLVLCLHSVGTARSTEGRANQIRLRDKPVTTWLAAYLVFAGLSLFWSVGVSPASSSAYWLALILDATTLTLLLSLYTPRTVAKSVLHGYVVGACGIAALAWMLPAQADLRLGDADYFNTNQIANVCALGIFCAQYLARKELHRTWIPILALSITLLRTLSKATLLAFVVSQCVLLFRDPNIGARLRKRILLTTSAVLIASSGLLFAYYDVYTNTGNQAETLTGRTAIWAWTLDKIPESLWMGHGFDSMWKIMPPFGVDRFECRHAEDELLQQLYAYGMVGSILFLAVYVQLYRAIRRCSDAGLRPLLAMFLLYIVIRGLAEAEPFDLLLPVWMLLVVEAIATDVSMDVRADAMPMLPAFNAS